MKKINFFLPDFYQRSYMNLMLLEIMHQYPQYFYKNIAVTSIYGTFPGAIWNGGRVTLGSCDSDTIKAVISDFNSRGIAIRYTFTNPLLEEKHLYDTFCNICMQLGDNGMNEVLVNSPVLEEYIRQNYPSYKIISSTTKCLRKDAFSEELKKDYMLVVADSSLNNTKDLFDITPKEKIEILLDHFCQDDCPKREAHYRNVGKCQLEFRSEDFPDCPHIKRDFYDIMQNHSFVTVEDLYKKYVPAGFSNFKLEGRAFNKYKIAESYMYYLVKPEYRDMVRVGFLRMIDGHS
jgi:collagenase-like PrtC family protease